jgi:hypothetical protein
VGIDTRTKRKQQMMTDYIFSVKKKKKGREPVKYRHDIGGEVSVQFKLELQTLRVSRVATSKNINH